MDVKNDLGGGKPTLLIAEDEESNYLLLKTILHKYCNLIRAKTGSVSYTHLTLPTILLV